MNTSSFEKTIVMSSVALLCSCVLSAADTESTPFPGVRHVNRHTTEPREIDMHIVIVDMKRPGVKITTTGPNDDPDTQIDFETTRQFVKRTGTHIGINGGFFGYTRKAVETGKGDLCSLAVSDGRLICGWGHNQHDAVNIGNDNAVTFVRRATADETGSATNPEVILYNAIAGNVRLIENGKILAKVSVSTLHEAIKAFPDHDN